MNRFLKRYARRFLPARLREALKSRFAAKFHQPVTANFVVEKIDSALRCTVDGEFSFVAPLECADQLTRFTTTAEGRAELHAFANAAREGGVLFDVGAHSGVVSAVFCAARPQNRAFAFEPSPILARRLEQMRNLNAFGERMSIEPIAIGDADKRVKMLVDPAGGFVQTERFEQTMWAAPERIEVQVETIEAAAARVNVVPQFVKIDIEGYELEAVRGAARFFARHKPTIFFELHLNYLEERKLSGRAVVETLARCGYSFFTGTGESLQPRQIYDSPLAEVHVVAR